MIPGSAQVAPLLRRHVLEAAWSRLTGARMPHAWRELERSQWYDGPTLRNHQLASLRELIAFATTHNAFYRERFNQAGVRAEDIKSLDDVRRIPILTKAQVRDSGGAMLSDGFSADKLMQAKTGGSTGKPIEVFFTEEVSQLRNASGRRNKRWAGWEVGETVGAVWGNPVFPNSFKERAREWVLAPTISLDTMSVSEASVRQFAHEWARARPTMLFGHAHSLFVLATMVRELGITTIRPKAIIPTSMMLMPHERREIETVFGTKATDIYGCEEVGLIAGECERHEGLHTNVEQLIVEVLDDQGQPAKPGRTGQVVVTDLLNQAMPFIRYSMEDVAEVAVQECSCGRAMPALKRIIGRTADFLKRADGSRVAGISLIENSLTRIPGIAQMQIVQEELRRIVLRVVPGEGFSAATSGELVEYFRETFPGAEIVLQETTAIPPEPNGKYRFSISRLAD